MAVRPSGNKTMNETIPATASQPTDRPARQAGWVMREQREHNQRCRV